MILSKSLFYLNARRIQSSHSRIKNTTTQTTISKKNTNNTRRKMLLSSGGVLLSTSSSLSMNTKGGAQARTKAFSSEQIAQVLKDPQFPAIYPFTQKDMQRYDESSDGDFYAQPRLVKHIDDEAIGALTKYYEKEFLTSKTKNSTTEDDLSVLDICSSWISHYPESVKFKRCAGTGMNKEELARNQRFTEPATVVDLNETPKLPYEDNSFDFVTNCVSVDYLTKPLEVMQEVRRVLKPGGRAIMSFSNRCFPTKAVSIWTACGDLDHIWIVGAYYHYANGFDAPEGIDISPNPGRTDPMYVVTATKTMV